jgi:hypothetical protein
MVQWTRVALSFLAAVLVIGTANPADAKIECRKGTQRVQGEWLVTPYCQDAYLAEVAREYGLKASAAAIRNNPNFKREVCLIVGHDIRVQQTSIEIEPLIVPRPW